MSLKQSQGKHRHSQRIPEFPPIGQESVGFHFTETGHQSEWHCLKSSVLCKVGGGGRRRLDNKAGEVVVCTGCVRWQWGSKALRAAEWQAQVPERERERERDRQKDTGLEVSVYVSVQRVISSSWPAVASGGPWWLRTCSSQSLNPFGKIASF